MANSDYTRRGWGTVTPSALMAYSIGPGDQFIGLIDYNPGTINVIPAIGNALLVGNEVMRVTSVNMPQIGVDRGCADTVPGNHPFGEMIWLLIHAGGDLVEYMATETIGVKVLMKSTGGEMDLENSPPNALTFNRRFARPYPPGNVKVNNKPFHTLGLTMDEFDVKEFLITWAHRDRVVQADQLIGHGVGSIGPEPGTTYVLRVYDADDVLRNTTTGITGTSIKYTITQATLDLESGTSVGVKFGYLTLHSVRQGFESWQGYRINFSVYGDDVITGWGNNWGIAWGN